MTDFISEFGSLLAGSLSDFPGFQVALSDTRHHLLPTKAQEAPARAELARRAFLAFSALGVLSLVPVRARTSLSDGLGRPQAAPKNPKTGST